MKESSRRNISDQVYDALNRNAISADIVDVEYHYIKFVYSTRFIIAIKSNEGSFSTFKIKKRFWNFRHFSHELNKIAAYTPKDNLDSKIVVSLAQELSKILENEPVEYIKKTSLKHSKELAKKRTKLIRTHLSLIQKIFPKLSDDASKCSKTLMTDFFLTDYNEEVKRRCSKESVLIETESLKRKNSSEHESVESPIGAGSSDCLAVSTKEKFNIFDYPEAAATTMIALMVVFLRTISGLEITLYVDSFILLLFISFMLGLKFHSLNQVLIQNRSEQNHPLNSTMLIRKSLSRNDGLKRRDSLLNSVRNSIGSSFLGTNSYVSILSPMPKFPAGAKLGSKHNCWSEAMYSDFQVRGPNYLLDKKKTVSGPFIFPARGIDLFLTDASPENVGRFHCVFGGKLRDVPSFIINFRLPWGVFVMYHEIPTKFLPFLRHCYEKSSTVPNHASNDDDGNSEVPPMENMSNSEVGVCKFLLGDDNYKNSVFKIVPVVVDGPWVVKSVVGGKRSIIGKKVPIAWNYTPANKEGKGELYLEADLDITASAAARSILSICRSYTTILTMDLGFVIEGKHESELPEQMLSGSRIHGMDPMNASTLSIDEHSFALDAMDKFKKENE